MRRWVVVALLLAVIGGAVLLLRARPVDAKGARVLHLTVASRFVHARMPLTLVVPAGSAAGRPLLVFLHGRGGDQNSELSGQMFAALRREGRRAPTIAFPYGGDHSYWHDRAGGRWTQYALREVIPAALRATGADGRRVAIGGISMGGFGAYDIARRAPGRFCAIGGHSAALWPTAADTAPGAFDNAADFGVHDLIGWVRARGARPFGASPVWLDGGDQDPFHAADEVLAHRLGIHMHVWRGGHDGDYWNAHWKDYLAFYGQALAACGTARGAAR